MKSTLQKFCLKNTSFLEKNYSFQYNIFCKIYKTKVEKIRKSLKKR